MKRPNDDKQEAPVPYRLPPTYQKVKAGCLPALLLILLSLALLGCGFSAVVRTFAEPIDENGCRDDCASECLEFDYYRYETHTYW